MPWSIFLWISFSKYSSSIQNVDVCFAPLVLGTSMMSLTFDFSSRFTSWASRMLIILTLFLLCLSKILFSPAYILWEFFSIIKLLIWRLFSHFCCLELLCNLSSSSIILSLATVTLFLSPSSDSFTVPIKFSAPLF